MKIWNKYTIFSGLDLDLELFIKNIGNSKYTLKNKPDLNLKAVIIMPHLLISIN